MTAPVTAGETVALLVSLLPWLAGFGVAVAVALQLARIARALETLAAGAGGDPRR